MDTSIKIPMEDIIELNTVKNELLRKDLRFSQKDLLDMAVKFSLERKRDFVKELVEKKRAPENDNTAEMTQRLLDLPPIDFGKNWHEEIDTIEHDTLLKKLKKKK